MGHWCIPNQNFVEALTYWIYNPDRKHLIVRSVVGTATDPTKTNKRAIPDAYVIRNYYPESDTDSKGREKGE